MEKKTEEEELKTLWEDNIGSLAYDLEEAFLEVFRKRSVELQKPAFYLGSIAMAAGHILQVTEKEFNYKHDLKASFDDILKQTYNHYRQHPSDEDNSSSVIPSIMDTTLLN